MSRKTIYKLPVIEKTLVLESDTPEKVMGKTNELLDTVKRESYQRGWEEALKKVEKENELVFQSLQKVVGDLKQEKNTIWIQCEKEIVKLALAIAKKVISEEISKDSSKIIEKIVAEAVDKVKENKILRIYLNPTDIEKLKQHKIIESMDINADCEIVKDTDIKCGGCKVVTDYGNIDARLETRWNEVETALREHTLETESVE